MRDMRQSGVLIELLACHMRREMPTDGVLVAFLATFAEEDKPPIAITVPLCPIAQDAKDRL